MKDKGYIQSFESLRGIAFLLIFLSHCSFLSGRMTYWGAFGVSIFIQMSGFLTGNKNNKITSVKEFVKKRLSKLYPLHIACMIGMLPFAIRETTKAGVTVLKLANVCFEIVANITMLQSFVPDRSIYFSLNSVAWYLTLVLTFSVLTKPLLKLANACVKRGGYCILLICYILEIIWTLIWRDSTYMHWAVYINPLFRTLDYFIGMIIGMLLRNNGKEKIHMMIPAVLLVVSLGMSCFFPRETSEALCVLWTPISALILISAYYNEVNKGVIFNCFSAVGRLSMELFLIHYLVISYMSAVMSKFSLTMTMVAVPFSLMISLAAAYVCRCLTRKLSTRGGIAVAN